MASEVARLRQQIEAECRSLQMLRFFSVNASHEIISAKFALLDKHYQQLIGVVGEAEATELSVTIYNTVMDKPVER